MAENGSIMILACSGKANVGQLANKAAVELTQEGFGGMFCLAGVGGKLPNFIQSVKDSPNLIVLDGCSVGCAKAIFKEAGLPLRNHVVVTDLGIEKNSDLSLPQEQVEMIKKHLKTLFAGSPFQMANPGGGCC